MVNRNKTVRNARNHINSSARLYQQPVSRGSSSTGRGITRRGPPTSPTAQNRRGSRVFSRVSLRVKIILLCSLLLLLGMIGFWGLTANRLTPKSTVNSFLFCAKHSYMRGMVKCFDPTEQALLELIIGDSIDAASDPQVRKILSRFVEYDIYPYLDPVIVSVEKGNYKAKVKVKVDINEEDLFFDFNMIKGRGLWYIHTITPSEN